MAQHQECVDHALPTTQASMIDDLVTKYSAETEKFKQLESARRTAKGGH